jgi:hypothetical protein
VETGRSMTRESSIDETGSYFAVSLFLRNEFRTYRVWLFTFAVLRPLVLAAVWLITVRLLERDIQVTAVPIVFSLVGIFGIIDILLTTLQTQQDESAVDSLLR